MRKHGGKWNLPAREEREGILEQKLRGKTREWIEDIVNEELDAALGTGWRERSTEPRGEYFETGADEKKAWNSQVIPRYSRRTDTGLTRR